MGHLLGVLCFFLQSKLNCELSGVYVLRSLCEDKHMQNAVQCLKIVDAFCFYVSACVLCKNPNTPNWSSMADDNITWGSTGVRDLLSISVALTHLFCTCIMSYDLIHKRF